MAGPVHLDYGIIYYCSNYGVNFWEEIVLKRYVLTLT